jgi:hypothetical protein
MNPDELHRLLRRLHEELGQARSLDDESRELLKLVGEDIGALPEPEAGAGERLSALERLAVRFESEHPALSAVARQLADALAKAGI